MEYFHSHWKYAPKVILKSSTQPPACVNKKSTSGLVPYRPEVGLASKYLPTLLGNIQYLCIPPHANKMYTKTKYATTIEHYSSICKVWRQSYIAHTNKASKKFINDSPLTHYPLSTVQHKQPQFQWPRLSFNPNPSIFPDNERLTVSNCAPSPSCDNISKLIHWLGLVFPEGLKHPRCYLKIINYSNPGMPK